MYFGKPTKAKNAFFSFGSFLLSAVMLYSWFTFDGIPSISSLESASGRVAWVKSEKYGVKFGLVGNQRSFDYASKGNAMGLVYDTLARRDNPVVTVLFNPNSPNSPIYSEDVFYGVFDLAIQGKPFRSHAEIAEAWRSDEKVGLWLSAIFAICGVYLAVASARQGRAT